MDKASTYYKLHYLEKTEAQQNGKIRNKQQKCNALIIFQLFWISFHQHSKQFLMNDQVTRWCSN